MHIINAVEIMGRQVGIEFSLNDEGVASLNMGENNSLFFERREDTMVVSLARKLSGDPMSALERGFEKCAPENDPRMGLRVALFREDTLVVISKLEKYHLNAGMADQILPYLVGVMDEIV